MTTARGSYLRWIADIRAESDRLLMRELASPRDAFYMASTSQAADRFYAVIDQWRAMGTHLVTGIRRHLRHPEDWVEDTRRAFDISRLLRFNVRDVNFVESFDLNNREIFSDTSGSYRLRNAFQRGREEPDWRTAVQSMASTVRNQLAALEQVDEADLADPRTRGQEIMGNQVTVNINSPLHRSPINIGGRQSVQFGREGQPTSSSMEALRAELGEVREAILTNQDLVIGVQRTLAATQWDEVMPALRAILDRMQALSGTNELGPDEVRALAMRAVNELELEHALDRGTLQHPIMQNLAASGIWSLLGQIFRAIAG